MSEPNPKASDTFNSERYAFTQNEMILAVDTLRKVWDYEKSPYFSKCLTENDMAEIDKRTVSYGISLGTLRKIFANPLTSH